MDKIDWSKAPDDATHAFFHAGNFLGWRKLIGGEWYSHYQIGKGGWDLTKEPMEESYVPRSALEATEKPWTGEDGSLPPVGLTVEVFDVEGEPNEAYAKHIGQHVRIIAHDHLTQGDDEGTGVAVYAYEGLHGEGYHALVASKFRPIRTAEQIAAEDREADAESLFQVIHPDGKWHKAEGLYKERFRCAIDARSRK